MLPLCVSKLHKSNTSLNIVFIGKVTSYHKKGEKCSYCCTIRSFCNTHIVYTYSVQTHCNAQCSNTFLRISLTYSCNDTSTDIDNCAFLKVCTSATAAEGKSAIAFFVSKNAPQRQLMSHGSHSKFLCTKESRAFKSYTSIVKTVKSAKL